jgi:hypothetical protein
LKKFCQLWHMAGIHIGTKIKAVVVEKGMSVTEFAKRIHRTRNVVYDIFVRESIDTGLLMKISQVLEHDFFAYYTLKNRGFVAEASEAYSHAIKEELELLKTEVELLKELTSFLEKKSSKEKKKN